MRVEGAKGTWVLVVLLTAAPLTTFGETRVLVTDFEKEVPCIEVEASGINAVFEVTDEQGFSGERSGRIRLTNSKYPIRAPVLRSATISVPVERPNPGAKALEFWLKAPLNSLFKLMLYEPEDNGEVWTLGYVHVPSNDWKHYLVPLNGKPQGAGALLGGAKPLGDGKISADKIGSVQVTIMVAGNGDWYFDEIAFTSEWLPERARSAEKFAVKVDAQRAVGHMGNCWRGVFGSPVTLFDALDLASVRVAAVLLLNSYPEEGKYNFKPVVDELYPGQGTSLPEMIQGIAITPRWLWPADAEGEWDAITTRQKGHSYPPKDYAKWERLIEDTVKHLRPYGATSFEVWNEPDHPNVFWYGTLEDYLALYTHTSQAVKRADPEAKVGGPAAGEPPSWIPELLAHCAKNELPLDFVSWHIYTDEPAVIRHMMQQIKAFLSYYPQFADVPVYLDEWNNDLFGLAWAGNVEQMMNGPFNAAFAAAAIREMIDADVEMSHFAMGKDWLPELFPGCGLLTENDVPKPVYNTFKMYNMMPRNRVQTISDPQHVGLDAIAARSNDEVSVIVWWYLPKTWTNEAQHSVQLDLTNLPPAGKYRVSRYVIDGTHSNYHAGPEHVELEQVETKTVQCPEATYHTTLAMELNTVQMIRVKCLE